MNGETTLIILVGILSVAGLFIFTAVLIYSSMAPSRVRERISRYVEIPPETPGTTQFMIKRREVVTGYRSKLNEFLGKFASKSLNLRLQSSNWQITVTEFIMVQIGAALLGFLIIWLISGSIIIGVIAAILFYLLPGFFLQQSIFRRQRKFQNQLVDVLVLIRGAVQAGFSLLQSMDVVVREMPAPAGEEFARVQREVQLGIPLGQSLENLSERMESDDLKMVVTAIIINSQVGGNLSLMLTAVTETIRNRIALLGEVRSLTSYARYASNLLTLLPFLTALIVTLLSPGYFSEAVKSPVVILMFIIALIGIILGNIWLRKLTHIEV